MGKKRRGPKRQGCDYSKLNPNATEFVPAVVSSCDGKYSAVRNASYWREIPKSSRPPPYTNNNNEKLSFSFLDSDGELTEEMEILGVNFVSELPDLVLENIFQHLDVTSIQNCRKVSRRWNDVIIKLQPNVIKDIERDADFLVRLVESRKFWDSPEEPFYIEADCATCMDWFNYSDFMFEIKHDVIKLLTYYLDCEDKSKKYICHLCPEIEERETSDEDAEEEEEWSDELSDDDEVDHQESFSGPRPRKETKKSRKQFGHLSHLLDCHGDYLDKILLKQRLIPLCGKSEPNDCEYTLTKILCESFFLGHAEQILIGKKYKPPPTPPSPRSPKMWESMQAWMDY